MAEIVRVTVRDSRGLVLEARERVVSSNRASVWAAMVDDLVMRYPDVERLTVEKLIGDEPCKV